MSVLWLTPAAWLGVALVTVPIAIHLLVRQHSRRVDYPSLRFLRPARLAAFRRRTIQDALLLLCRAGIVFAAVGALAGPVLQTAARSAAFADRVARAIVAAPGTSAAEADAVAGDAFKSRTFVRETVADAVHDAVRWLGEQPPAAREVVFVGDFRRGTVVAGQLWTIPASAGIRFVTIERAAAPRDITWPVLLAHDGRLVVEQRQVHFADEGTRVSGGAMTTATGDLLRIVAAPADQALADAALRAALDAGLHWPEPSRRLLVVWEGADDTVVRQMAGGAVPVRMTRPAPDLVAASAVVSAIERATAVSAGAAEPVRIDPDQLRAWSRPPGAVPADAPLVDEGDRRWFWGLALGLLMLEHGLRRARTPDAAGDAVDEVRVA